MTDIREFLNERYPGVLVYFVDEVDMRAIDAYELHLPDGRNVNCRVLRDSKSGQQFVEVER